MEKDFDRWNKKKQNIHDQQQRLHFEERELRWCAFGKNVGSELNGKNKMFGRPVIIFRKFAFNLFWVIPLTTKTKVGNYYFPVSIKEDEVKRWCVLHHMKLVDGKRFFGKKMGKVSKDDFGAIRNAVKELIS